ncbi:MAG TPA: DUF6600 domain-containing protein [Bacteroidota bacterium]|nr:DUF6600 domain-containing protein [Bacteroidota bacterium]
MKFFGLAFSLIILTGMGYQPTHAQPSGFSASAGVEYFYDHLQPYGEWIEFDAGFYGWRPVSVMAGWRPYCFGRWVWTDFGWYWVSHEPFGWIVFHYGRWYYDDYYGWIWIPDRVWGPAWVEWRYNDDYIGWAPLPPYARLSITVGIRFTTRWYAPPRYWNFVTVRHFGGESVDRHIEPEEQSRRLIGYTRSGGRYEVNGDRIINRGVDRSLIERGGNVRIERMEIQESRERGERLIRDGERGRIEVFRPDRSPRETSRERFEARRADRPTSLDIRRIRREPDGVEYERNRQRESIGGRERGSFSRDDNEAQDRRAPRSILRRLGRRPENPREELRHNEAEPRSRIRSFDTPSRREERSVRPAPPPRQQPHAGERSRRSGARREQ